jgi:glycosyltransferase involved in cell wall biosynthesis
MSITLITPTGDRPEAFELTRKWIASQTVQPDQWIVVDDGFTELPEHLRKDIDYIRRVPKKNEGHTLTLNIKEAVKHIEGDIILIIEDDDWYGPRYIETMWKYLQMYDLVGEAYARYYHLVAMKYRRIGNNAHASFCQTGFVKRLLPIFIQCIEGDPYIDARLWNVVTEHKFLIKDTDDVLKIHCSLKGLKGRKGIGSGHNESAEYYNVDVGLEYLRRWVGEENARLYMEHVGQSYQSALLVGVDRKGHKAIPVPVQSVAQSLPPLKDKITVITCTGDRPEAFDLCKKWMKAQTVQPDQWIVVDDGSEYIKQTREFEYYRRNKTPNDYTHTLCLNILKVLPHIRNDRIIIMEDDDWYHPTYIDYMNRLLDKADLVGIGKLIFYYPQTQSFMEKLTLKQPAFAQTAFRGCIVPVIKRICESAPSVFELCGKGLVDSLLWKDPLNVVRKEKNIRLLTNLKTASGASIPAGTIFSENIPAGIVRKAQFGIAAEYIDKNTNDLGKKLIVDSGKYLSVGMKGLPGRKGLTSHHNPKNTRYKKDIDLSLIKSILKNDIEYYLDFFP